MTKKQYSEKEFSIVEKHIRKKIGKYDQIFHGVRDDVLHLDICVIKPNKKRNYYTLVTLGMGAYKMNVQSETAKMLNRIELMMMLPPTWDITSDKPEWRWPLTLMADLSAYPMEHDTWFECNHTVKFESNFGNTNFSSAFIGLPFPYGQKSGDCAFNYYEGVMFYQVLPLYKEELEKILDGKLIPFKQISFNELYLPINIERKNYGPLL